MDDVILFAKAKTSQTRSIDNLLNNLCYFSNNRLERYLRFKTKWKGTRKMIFLKIYDKVDSKFVSWKSGLLKKALVVLKDNFIFNIGDGNTNFCCNLDSQNIFFLKNTQDIFEGTKNTRK